jgi:hypothetical protein
MLKQEIEEIVKKLDKKHVNDPSKAEDFEEIVNILSKSRDAAIACLDELDENEISWISFSFEELAAEFQSQQFIDCVKRLVTKFPGISYLKDDLEDAIAAMK